ncbi:Quino protein alcohol dehydrogenase-like protein [Diplogelasinospora grovesii]|uniref:Quino protein alcohol dehydrogenase-like protein n=1 Tax=Diplogelasinospora grovesii TaxID=303347 RepID=A0AAN6N3S2_9PEZI|nr:Quino protein alcohol dehydrogenase-like protein [Diplogelasinospora grovesii]
MWFWKSMHLAALVQVTHFLQGAVCDAPSAATSGYGIDSSESWMGWGGNSYNNRWASSNQQISSSTIESLGVHCQVPFAGGVSATPTIVGGIAYFPAWNGSLVAYDYTACKIKWQIDVKQLTLDYGAPDALQAGLLGAGAMCACSRTSPQVDLSRKMLYFGTQFHALMVAADLDTGKVLGVKQIHDHPLAQITLSPSLASDGTLFTGASSAEESVVYSTTNYTCCNFVGSAVALKFNKQSGTFTTVWDVAMLPPRPATETGTWWSGVAVWGSEPAIDAARGQVYYGTGNVYSVPDDYLPCTADPTTKNCTLPARVWQESILALDMKSGKLNWIRRLGVLDAWTVACTVPSDEALCPQTPGTDADFGMAPALVLGGGKRNKDVVVVGQKNGNLYSLSADTGEIEWASAVGPGGTSGGLSWGVSVDNSGRVYFVEVNYNNVAWSPKNATENITNSAYGAASLSSGKVLWEVPVAGNFSSAVPPATVGDLVITGRASATTLQASVVAVRKSTGEVVLDFPVDTYFQSGISVMGKYILFGTGYHGVLNGSFYVLSV